MTWYLAQLYYKALLMSHEVFIFAVKQYSALPSMSMFSASDKTNKYLLPELIHFFPNSLLLILGVHLCLISPTLYTYIYNLRRILHTILSPLVHLEKWLSWMQCDPSTSSCG